MLSAGYFSLSQLNLLWKSNKIGWSEQNAGVELHNHTKTAKSKDEILNYVFAHRKDDDEIFPLTVDEIATAQKKDKTIQRDKQAYVRKLVENTHVLCKDGRLVIPKKLQYRAIAWYHHYLQHPGHTQLEETLKQAMYWTDMRSSIRQFVKQCNLAK